MNIFKKILSKIKSLFLSGLFTILPIILTVFIVTFTYDLLSRWLKPLRGILPTQFRNIPGFEFLIVTISILIIGIFIKSLFISPIVSWFEKLIGKIPMVRTIYSSSKILVDFFNVPNPTEVKRKVVLIEFPRKNCFNIAFLLEDACNSFEKLIPQEKKKDNLKYYKIFMPNSPNPTSGYFLILPEDEIIHTNLTFEEAIKTVVSCGLITPESLKNIE
jgi:uncharacterized membrane protein